MRWIFIVFLLSAKFATAQTIGTITINDKAGAAELIDKHIFFNKEHDALPGYRIQIYSGTSLVSAKDIKVNFLRKFPEYNASIVFEAPNYKLRAGNYTNRFDANRDLQDIIAEYTTAYVVKDLINISEK